MHIDFPTAISGGDDEVPELNFDHDRPIGRDEPEEQRTRLDELIDVLSGNEEVLLEAEEKFDTDLEILISIELGVPDED